MPNFLSSFSSSSFFQTISSASKHHFARLIWYGRTLDKNLQAPWSLYSFRSSTSIRYLVSTLSSASLPLESFGSDLRPDNSDHHFCQEWHKSILFLVSGFQEVEVSCEIDWLTILLLFHSTVLSYWGLFGWYTISAVHSFSFWISLRKWRKANSTRTTEMREKLRSSTPSNLESQDRDQILHQSEQEKPRSWLERFYRPFQLAHVLLWSTVATFVSSCPIPVQWLNQLFGSLSPSFSSTHSTASDSYYRLLGFVGRKCLRFGLVYVG